MKVRASFGREHDDIENLFGVPCQPLPRHPKNNYTHAEDGANGGSFDGSPDKPLDDGVGLWETVKGRRSITNFSVAQNQGEIRTAESRFASAQVEEQNYTGRKKQVRQR